MEKALYLPEGQNDLVWAVIMTGSPWPLLAGYLLLINLCTFAAFGIDKWKARHPGKRRIPERNLFLGAIAGGSLGALLGMRIFHHKTLHRSFRIGIPLILFLQIIISAGLYLYWNVIR